MKAPKRKPLDELIADAQARYHAMTPDQQALMWQAQRRSWVRGELMLEYPDMTKKEAEQRVLDAERGMLTLTGKGKGKEGR